MKRILFGLLVMITSHTYAQNTGTVRGKILDGELYNEPLLMATVKLKNTDWSTQTNFSGNFEITEVTPGSYLLDIRFVGYENTTLSVEVKPNETIEIIKSVKAKSLPINSVTELAKKEIAGNVSSYPNAMRKE